MVENNKPKDCYECQFFDENGKHLKSSKAHFPSLCEKNLLFFNCKGKQGLIKTKDITYNCPDCSSNNVEWRNSSYLCLECGIFFNFNDNVVGIDEIKT